MGFIIPSMSNLRLAKLISKGVKFSFSTGFFLLGVSKIFQG